MNLDHLKPAWAYFKQIQTLEAISREEILELIETEEVATYQSTKYKYILINSLVFTLNLLLYQSC